MNPVHIADRIYLSWRSEAGKRRHVVGVFNRTQTGNANFNYLVDNIRDAFENGFRPMTAFPSLDTYYENVLPIISRRLVDPERSDRIDYLKFWAANDDEHDAFDLIALTQAWLTNDRYEFLADFHVHSGLTFITDLAGQTHINLGKDEVLENEVLTFENETENEFDSEAVAVLSEAGKKVGYIKKVHCRVFSTEVLNGITPTITVHKREMNGKLRRLFVKCSFS